jgi:hypothetical protein
MTSEAMFNNGNKLLDAQALPELSVERRFFCGGKVIMSPLGKVEMSP